MAITPNEIQQEYFIVFLDKADATIKYVCKYEPLKSIDLIKDTLSKITGNMEPVDKVLLLERSKLINLCADPSARFLVVKE